MARDIRVYNFFSIQVLFNDRSRMTELLDIVNQVENMGGNLEDITVQVVDSEVDRQKIMNEICEEMPSLLYGKYIN